MLCIQEEHIKSLLLACISYNIVPTIITVPMINPLWRLRSGLIRENKVVLSFSFGQLHWRWKFVFFILRAVPERGRSFHALTELVLWFCALDHTNYAHWIPLLDGAAVVQMLLPRPQFILYISGQLQYVSRLNLVWLWIL